MAASTKEAREDDRIVITEKKTRKRKKKLYKEILQQMEFYFSDANLNKDRFLYRLMCETDDGRVDLREFLKFKKIRALTDDINEIARAISSSEVLQVIDDNKFVVRKTAVQIKEDVDQCTIYVEGLPPQADHDWFRQIFAPFGKLAYISLPRFRTTRKLKGFAFLEFETSEEAALACKYFNPTVVGSGLPILAKELQDERSSVPGHAVKEPSRKRQRVEETVSEISAENPTPEAKESPPKKQRKIKKESKEKDAVQKLHLRVMPKLEWRRLKNIYLGLQRANMAAVKKSLGMIPNLKVERRQKSPSAAALVEDVISPPKLPDFTLGVIVKFETVEPVISAKLFRSEFKESAGVLYVDLKDGQSVGHIRCNEPENARRLLSELKEKYSTASILEGEDEANYWGRIASDKEAKVGGKSKSKPVRGKDKVIAKAVQLTQKSNVHIRFDD